MNDLPSFNRVVALERVGGDEELLREVVQIYLAEYPGLLDAIRQAVATRSAEGLHRSAHTLKGSLATMGAEAAAALAFALEAKGRNSELSGVLEKFQELEAELMRLQTDLDAWVSSAA